MGWIPVQGTKISPAAQCGKKKVAKERTASRCLGRTSWRG